MRHAVVIALSLAACAADDPQPPSGPQVSSHVISFDYPGSGNYQLDLLFVVDNTTDIASYASNVAEITSSAAAKLQTIGDDHLDLHVAVTTNGGALRTSPAVAAPYIESSIGFDLVRRQNFEGSFADALASLMNVGASAAPPNQPLGTMKTALVNAGDFVRPYATEGVAIISAGDDPSSIDVTELASWLKAQKDDPTKVVVAGMYPRPAPRLDAFLNQFPNRSTFAELAAADHASVFDIFGALLKTTLGAPCLEQLPLDVDPDTAGDQWDCSIAAVYDGVEHVLPRCGNGVTGPCWDIVIDRNICQYAGSGLFTMTGGYSWAFHPSIRGQCVVE